MKKARTIIITAIVTGAICIAGSVYAALVISNGNATVQVPVQDTVQVAQPSVTVQKTANLGTNQQNLVSSGTKQVETAPLTEDQRITALELRVSALEAKER